MDRSDWSRRFCFGDYFLTFIFPSVTTKQRMDVLAGSVRVMVVGICCSRRLGAYALVGSIFQEQRGATSDLDTPTTVADTGAENLKFKQ